MDRPMAPMHASPQLSPADARTADALFRAYGGRLFGYFRFMLGSESGAKHALAETLAAAAPEAGRARVLDEYGPRMFMLAHAECHKHQFAEAVGAGQHWTVVTGSGNPVLPEIARRAVARLAPDVREAYVLSAPHNNLSLPEMAEILGVGLDSAADLRAQAGLDFVRAVAQCANEAGYIQFGGADLRIRAEESLERDAAEPAPPLPMLSGPALAGFADDIRPPRPRQSLSPLPPSQVQQPPRTPLPAPSDLPSALPSSVALPPPSALPSPYRQTLPPPPPPPPDATIAEPFSPTAENPTRFDQAVPGAFHGGPDYDGAPGYEDAYGGEPDSGYHAYGGPGGTGDHRGLEEDYRASMIRTGPLRAITGPMMLGDYSPRGRRRRQVLAWTGGGVAVAAVAVIGWQVLASGPDNTLTLTHGSLPTTSVPSGPGGAGGAMGARPTARPSHSPTASQPPTTVPAGTSGTGAGSGAQNSGASGSSGGAAPAPAAPRPTTAPQQSPAPRKTSPAPVRTSSKPATTPSTSSTSPTTPSTSSTSPSAPSAAGSP